MKEGICINLKTIVVFLLFIKLDQDQLFYLTVLLVSNRLLLAITEKALRCK